MTNGAEESKAASAELGTLVERMQGQQRTLLIACMTLLLFIVSPNTNALLFAARDELVRFHEERWGKVVAAVEQQAVADPSLQSLNDALKRAGFELDWSRRKLSREEQGLLGYQTPQSLRDAVDLVEKKARRCAPMLDESVAKSTARLGHGKALVVTDARWGAVRDAEALSAVQGVLDAASSAHRAQEELQKAPTQKGGKPEKVNYPPAPASTLTVEQGGRPVVIKNPLFESWQRGRAEFDNARNLAQTEEVSLRKSRAALEQAAEEVQVTLNDRLKALRWAIQMQTQAHGEPRYVVAHVKFADVTRFGDSELYLPARCEQRELLMQMEGGSVRVLGSSRLLEAWPALMDLNATDSIKRVDEMLMRAERSIEVLGFSVPERLVTRLGPVLLLVTLLWHILYAVSYRKLASNAGAGATTSSLPDAPGHWTLPIITGGLVVVVSWLLWERANFLADRLLITACGLAGVVAAVAMVWPIGPTGEPAETKK